MNIEYLKEKFIPKNNKLKVIYGVLWILEPWIMILIMTYKLSRSKK